MKTMLGIFCKYPTPGNVKTRLARDIGSEAATQLYEAFLSDIVDRMRTTADERILCYTPADADSETYFSTLGGGKYQLQPQVDGNLGDRLNAFFDKIIRRHPCRAVVIGSDSPTISEVLVQRSFNELDHHDAVLGRSEDGGYYLLGLRRIARQLFDDIDWSTTAVYEQQMQRLTEASFTRTSFAPITEVDTSDDLNSLRRDPLLPSCLQTCRVLEKLDAM